ncbi:MAG: hypothetical protein PW791_04700 [Neorhizobium sp.]|nr:hypothetical protein [Neorhizobium sp.]
MAKKQAPDAQVETRIGRRVNRKVSVLMTEIEKEAVPDRLLKPALDLQKALGDKGDAENTGG